MVLSTTKLYSAQDHISCEVHRLVFDIKVFAKLLYIFVGWYRIKFTLIAQFLSLHSPTGIQKIASYYQLSKRDFYKDNYFIS